MKRDSDAPQWMHDEISALREKNEELRFLIEEMTTPPKNVVAGLTRYQSRMVGLLMRHPGRVVPQAALFTAMYYDRSDVDAPEDVKIVRVQICMVRKRAPHLKITTVWGLGYRYDPPAA